jgi:hypothetical protein
MPLRLLIDEDSIDRRLWNAIQQHNATSPGESLDVLRVGDEGAPRLGTLDPNLVQWAIQNQRIIISIDFNTLIAWHDDCVSKGQATPGLLIIRPGATIPAVVESLVLISHCSTSVEWSNCCNFIPLPGARE